MENKIIILKYVFPGSKFKIFTIISRESSVHK